MRQLFISDLHLSDQQPELAQALFALLKQKKSQIDELYILGDFFEIWLGDDALTPIATQVQSFFEEELNGIQIYLMHGNRDFLMGEAWAKSLGATLLPEGFEIEVAGQKAILCHGDHLCTDDVGYQAFKQQVRNPAFIDAFLAKTIEERTAIAKEMREGSQAAQSEKSMDIMDVNLSAVEDYAKSADTSLIIHGHTHRPQVHTKDAYARIVLGDWCKDHAYILEANDDAYQLIEFAYPAE
jgi:UDP-2,3-diacylglucosamine hydrolase